MAAQGPYCSISAFDRGDDYESFAVCIAYVFVHPDGPGNCMHSNGRKFENGTFIRAGEQLPNQQILYHCHSIVKVSATHCHGLPLIACTTASLIASRIASLIASLIAFLIASLISDRLSGRVAGGAWLARDANLRALELVDLPAAPDDSPHTDLRGARRMRVLNTAPHLAYKCSPRRRLASSPQVLDIIEHFTKTQVR